MNRLSSLFARRYLLSRRSHSVINIISRVSSVAVGVPVAAMIILLSVFNGFEELVKGLYGNFDPDIAVTAAEGKVLGMDTVDLAGLRGSALVQEVSAVMEDDALLEYRGRQYIAYVRGVDSLYGSVIPIGGMVVDGSYEPWFGEVMQVLVGQGVAYNLGVNRALYDPIVVIAPRRGASFGSILPIESYRRESIFPSGIFALDAETDGKYVITPIEFTRKLFDYPDGATTLMVKLTPGADPEAARAEISNLLGEHYKVLTRYQQKASLYRIMTYEKWGIFLIILMVLVIASFSITGSVAMLIIDKRRDIRTVLNMGGSVGFARSIFVKEGMLVALSGAVAGLALGLLLCWVQAAFGVIRIPAETFLVDRYPVVVKLSDIAAVAVSFIAVSYIITKFTVSRMIPRSSISI